MGTDDPFTVDMLRLALQVGTKGRLPYHKAESNVILALCSGGRGLGIIMGTNGSFTVGMLRLALEVGNGIRLKAT